MKKVRIEKERSPFSFSHKKSMMMKHEMLFTPYKIEWKNVQPPTSNLLSSRTFFNTMKNQLSNLKNDVEKLIKKENFKGENNVGNVLSEDNSLNGSRISVRKCYPNDGGAAYSKQRRLYGEVLGCDDRNRMNLFNEEMDGECCKYDKLLRQFKEKEGRIQNLLKQNRVQNDLINELKKENNELYVQIGAREIQKINIIKQYEQQVLKEKKEERSLSESHSKLSTNKADEDEKLLNNENKCKLLYEEIQNYKMENQSLKNHIQFIQSKNQNYYGKLEQVNGKLDQVNGKYREKEFYIRELQEKLESLRFMQRQEIIKNETHTINMKLELEKQKEKQDKFITKYTLQAKQAENLFTQQMKQLQQKYEEQIKAIEDQNIKLVNMLNAQKSNHMAKESKQGDFKLLGVEYQKKLNSVIEINYDLKNKITSLESDVYKLEMEKQAFREEIRILQEIKKAENVGEEVVEHQWKKVTDQLYALKKEKQNLIEQFQLKIMKLENELQSAREEKNKHYDSNMSSTNQSLQSLNTTLKQQLVENMCLKQRIKTQSKESMSKQQAIEQLEERLKIMTEQFTIEKKKIDILKQDGLKQSLTERNSNMRVRDFIKQLNELQKKYSNLDSLLQVKNKQILAKNDFIERVLISKTGKKEEEDQLTFILREFKSSGDVDQNYY